MGNLLIGSQKAKLDKSGRIKIPEKFRAAIEEQYGKELYITSLQDDFIQIFPLPVWVEMSGPPKKNIVYPDPDFQEFWRQAHSKGISGEIDAKGRVLISPKLRENAGLEKEVEVIGMHNYLEIWDKNRLAEKIEKKPLTYDDFKRISKLMSDGKPE
jgi:transcriptional regulator MraZ